MARNGGAAAASRISDDVLTEKERLSKVSSTRKVLDAETREDEDRESRKSKTSKSSNKSKEKAQFVQADFIKGIVEQIAARSRSRSDHSKSVKSSVYFEAEKELEPVKESKQGSTDRNIVESEPSTGASLSFESSMVASEKGLSKRQTASRSEPSRLMTSNNQPRSHDVPSRHKLSHHSQSQTSHKEPVPIKTSSAAPAEIVLAQAQSEPREEIVISEPGSKALLHSVSARMTPDNNDSSVMPKKRPSHFDVMPSQNDSPPVATSPRKSKSDLESANVHVNISDKIQNKSIEHSLSGKKHCASQSDLRFQLEQFNDRHQQDLKMIKQCNLDITAPEAKSTNVHSRRSGVGHSSKIREICPQLQVMDRSGRRSISSDGESQPPILHYADSPEPDPFNFMASVKRKYQDEQYRLMSAQRNDANLASESMLLSEGPLSTTMSSDQTSKSEKKKTMSETSEDGSSESRCDKSVASLRPGSVVKENGAKVKEPLVSLNLFLFYFSCVLLVILFNVHPLVEGA